MKLRQYNKWEVIYQKRCSSKGRTVYIDTGGLSREIWKIFVPEVVDYYCIGEPGKSLSQMYQHFRVMYVT